MWTTLKVCNFLNRFYTSLKRRWPLSLRFTSAVETAEATVTDENEEVKGIVAGSTLTMKMTMMRTTTGTTTTTLQ